MLGTLRLILASMVAASHGGWRLGSLNPGVIAVVGFYLISGYVMTRLLRRHYGRASAIPAFYADRALRLLPAYYLIAFLTALFVASQGPLAPFLEQPLDVRAWLENVLIVPLNYYMWNGSDHRVLIPPAWSLGAEVQFYLIVPLILLARLRLPLLVISAGIYLAAYAGIVHTEWYGYRLLPGVLFMFLLGSIMADLHAAKIPIAGRFAWLVAGAAMLLAGLGEFNGALQRPYNPETLLGLALALPLLHHLAPKARASWDERAGDLSYPVFLGHFLVFWCWPMASQSQLPSRLLATMVLAACIHYLIERPILALRHKLRQN